MTASRAALHTALIEREDALLEQLDTCHQVAAALWHFLGKSEEPFHVPTAKRLLSALHTVERSIDDELTDVRLSLIALRHSREDAPPEGTTH